MKNFFTEWFEFNKKNLLRFLIEISICFFVFWLILKPAKQNNVENILKIYSDSIQKLQLQYKYLEKEKAEIANKIQQYKSVDSLYDSKNKNLKQKIYENQNQTNSEIDSVNNLDMFHLQRFFSDRYQ